MEAFLILTCFSWLQLGYRVFASFSDLQFIVVGDWGDSFYNEPSNQNLVASAMDAWASRDTSNPNFIITVGDNFYPEGVTSPWDECFDTKWKLMYNSKRNIKDLPWYICLGNHDYGPLDDRSGPNSVGREFFQLKRSEFDSQWNFPSLWYSFIMDSPAGSVELFIIDTVGIKEGLNNHTTQIEWIRTAIASSNATVKLVFGHHPIYSIGLRAPGEETIKRALGQVIIDHHVDAYIAGHEHNFQHIHKEEDNQPDHFIFGGGGREIKPKLIEAEKTFNKDGFKTFFSYGHGFGVITINETSILTQSFGIDNMEYLYQAVRDIHR